VLLLVPVAGGLVAGHLCRRSGAVGVAGWRPVVGVSAGAGGVRGGAVAVLCLLASGPAGPGRLGETGPTWWLVAVLAGLEVAAVMAATLFVLRRR
jgi:LPXTG-motif cell wall-anchored protein